MRSRCIWVTGVEKEDLHEWAGFLLEYQRGSQLVPCDERGVIALALEGLDLGPFEEEVALAVHPWRGVTTRLDMLLLSARQIDASSEPLLRRRLALATTVELAGTDPLLADELSCRPLEELLAPVGPASRCVEERGHPGRSLSR